MAHSTAGEPRPYQGGVKFIEETKDMRVALFSCLVLALAGFSTAAFAKHTHHVHHAWHGHPEMLSTQARWPAGEILTTVGTPECHLQGRLFRAAHHCPPEAVAAAPR
jgi:hypothetical protein